MKMSFEEAMRLKDRMPKGLFRRVDNQAADEIWLAAIEVAERYHGILQPSLKTEPVQEPDAEVCDGSRGGLCIHQDPNQCKPERDCPAFSVRSQHHPAASVQEPAFHGFMNADGTQVDLCFTPSAPCSDGTYATAYYTAPPKSMSVQESVGEILPKWSTEQECIVGTWAYLNDLGKKLPVNTLLYAAPQQRKPLSEDEAWSLIEQDYRMEEYGDAAMELIRRTERAHRIMEEK